MKRQFWARLPLYIQNNNTMSKKINIPSTFTIVFSIIVVCAALTWFVPGGQFERQTVTVDGHERNVVVPDSYHRVDNSPQTWQIFTSFFKGFERTSSIIVFILMIGGAFWVLNETDSINKGISLFLQKLQRFGDNMFLRKIGVNNILIVIIMLLFSLFGSVFGMSEETIAFIIVFVPLAISMGYDSITGVLMCYVAAHVGFAGAMLNPFTIGIAQGLAGLPTFSGIGYRLLCWIILTLIAIIFTLIYANYIKNNPEKSITYDIDEYWRNKSESSNTTTELKKSVSKSWIVYSAIVILFVFLAIKFPFTDITIGQSSKSIVVFPVFALFFAIIGFFATKKSAHHLVLTILLFTILTLVTGVLGYDWYIMEIAGLFFAMGILSGYAFGFEIDKIFKEFILGCKDILSAALIVGLAGGIIIILEDGKIIDTLLFAIANGIGGAGKIGSTAVMYALQNALNIVIPSGSAKAALTIPMMTEWSDLINIPRQLTVLAFQFGDGFTNMITPTSGVLIGVLGVAKIPYARWFKFIWKFILLLILVGFILLLPPLFHPFVGF